MRASITAFAITTLAMRATVNSFTCIATIASTSTIMVSSISRRCVVIIVVTTWTQFSITKVQRLQAEQLARVTTLKRRRKAAVVLLIVLLIGATGIISSLPAQHALHGHTGNARSRL